MFSPRSITKLMPTFSKSRTSTSAVSLCEQQTADQSGVPAAPPFPLEHPTKQKRFKFASCLLPDALARCTAAHNRPVTPPPSSAAGDVTLLQAGVGLAMPRQSW
ncbi:hypothetical protein TraAM80_00790 [Trypanosoma rangeli]|uniref:Uncharacterized protein n=1 Tax=Trypanosoma rangeli TaxID=5698 RepID=A0A3R7N247_TRYRA|nr:uncharacterized protein TraAM80_00790 [Trypanosoma rangeli]RNF11598.1 hypothetical protein TraAM80_00790 [Trypanosoma rangeli]|eukprot:RNF11598.1 hypothetical protein TraAM80_00790 [Trypanosoma rangeli]